MKRLILFTVVVALISVLAVPVYASNDSGWIELLEYSSVQDDGDNDFIVNGTSGSVTIPILGEKKLRRVDMLILTPSGHRFTSASVTAGGSTTNLDVLAVGGFLTRVVGYIPNTSYKQLTVNFKKSSTSPQTYEVLSCKVTPIGVQEFVVTATVYFNGATYSTGRNIDIAGTTPDNHISTMYQMRIDVKDWQKYDSLSVWGSIDAGSIDSVRASVSTTALSMNVNYFQANDSGGWTDIVMDVNPSTGGIDNTGAQLETPFYGKYLYALEIDLTNVDRTLTDPLYIYITGHYDDMFGATFNCQYVNGSVVTADTSDVTWWNRFTSFMTGLFSPSDPDAEDFGSTMESQAGELEDAVDELDQVTKPDVDDLDISLDEYLGGDGMAPVSGFFDAIFSNQVLVTMLIIALTCAFASYALFGKR